MIRRLAPADCHKVSALIRNTLLISNSGDYDLEILGHLAAAFAPEKIRALSRRREIFVHEHLGQIQGTISLEGVTIYSFFVAPDKQRKGLGSALLRHVEQRVRDRGARFLKVAASLTAAPFYRKMGYQVLGEERDPLYGRVVIMRKFL